MNLSNMNFNSLASAIVVSDESAILFTLFGIRMLQIELLHEMFVSYPTFEIILLQAFIRVVTPSERSFKSTDFISGSDLFSKQIKSW